VVAAAVMVGRLLLTSRESSESTDRVALATARPCA
jgi:hypothetical protein